MFILVKPSKGCSFLFFNNIGKAFVELLETVKQIGENSRFDNILYCPYKEMSPICLHQLVLTLVNYHCLHFDASFTKGRPSSHVF